MDRNDVLSQIDLEISRLKMARAALAGAVGEGKPVPKKRRKKRRLSAEGRAKIVAALRKRWAAAKKAEK